MFLYMFWLSFLKESSTEDNQDGQEDQDGQEGQDGQDGRDGRDGQDGQDNQSCPNNMLLSTTPATVGPGAHPHPKH